MLNVINLPVAQLVERRFVVGKNMSPLVSGSNPGGEIFFYNSIKNIVI
jgi:hypothetical protein